MQAGAAPDAFDIVVIGGGINGCGIARDAAGRGLSVLLAEQGDLAGGTSSASTKLIHGGLRYLELFEFRLVREALTERERLLQAAPHIIWPLRFVLPHDRGIRPAWLVRLGLFLYDHIAPRKRLPGCETIRFAEHPYGKPLKESFKVGFAYSDCWVEDSRLVVLAAMDARERGAEICVRTRFVSARREGDGWNIALQDAGGGTRHVRARALVNAAGPWVAEVLRTRLGVESSKNVRLIKGSHIVVRRLYEGEHAYILQNADKRIVFTIPYERDFTLIGTTDIAYDQEPHRVAISEEETRYLCDSVSHCFRTPVESKDVVWSYAGVRPLFDDGSLKASVVTRDYVFDLEAAGGAPPALSVFGGKITTFRRLAEHAMDELARFFPAMGPAWTETSTLPGGDIADGDFAAFVAALRARKPFLAADAARRLARAYGTRLEAFIGKAQRAEDLGRDFGKGLTAAEIDYLVSSEWAVTAEDILWRRSKLGLHLPQSTAGEIAAYLEGRRSASPPSP
ncbi:homodimeric glycerol 3-phosphate dehydrogenase (quinone) [Rhizobiales bacterium GAS113]|nr:homodimeric glycerol 3-phosphate dehydrogenase (quinone) [Rhizobiales bacterium GAS113]